MAFRARYGLLRELSKIMLCMYIKIKYQIPSAGTFQVIKDYSYYQDMLMDGTSIGLVNTYAFPSAGEYEIEFVNNNSLLNQVGKYDFDAITTIRSVEIGEGYESIGMYAFLNCTGLESVVLPSTMEIVGEGSFYGCTSLNSIEFNEGLNGIYQKAFESCTALSAVDIPDTVSTVGAYAFRGCSNFRSVRLSESCNAVSEGLFAGCSKLRSIVIPDIVETIYMSAFGGCSSLETVVFGNNLKTINGYAFQKCTSLSSIEIPEGITAIASSTFLDCSGLTTVILPSTLTSIGYYSFARCTSLEVIECNAVNAPEVNMHSFYKVKTGGFLYYPEGSDYSSMLSEDQYYLGYYGWNGIQGGIPEMPHSITVSPRGLSAPYMAGNRAFTATTENIDRIDVVYEADWLRYEGDGFEGTFYYDYNNGAERSVDIVFKGYWLGEEVAEDTITIEQRAEGLDIQPSSIEFSHESCYIDINILNYSNFDSIEIDRDIEMPDWLNVYYSNGEISVSADYNDGDERMHVVGIYGYKGDDRIDGAFSVLQHAQGDAFFWCFPNEFDFPAAGGEQDITSFYGGYSNFEFNDTYIGIDRDARTVSMLPNYEAETKEVVPQLSAEYEGMRVDVPAGFIFRQAAYSGEPGTFAPEYTSITLDYNSSYFDYDLHAEDVYGVDVNITGTSWIRTKRIDDWVYRISVTENTESMNRTGSVKFTGTGGVETTLAITQLVKNEGDTEIIPEYTEGEFSNNNTSTDMDVDYVNTQDDTILPAETDSYWINIKNEQVITDSDGNKLIRYDYDLDEYTGSTPRTGKIIYRVQKADGTILTKEIIITQKAKEEGLMATITIYGTRLDFDATGGSKTIQVDYTNASVINTPTVSQSWISVEDTGQEGYIESTNTRQKQYRITMEETPFTRQTNVAFSCTGTNGSTKEASLICYQSANGSSDVESRISPNITNLKITADGVNSIQTSMDYVNVRYIGYTSTSQAYTPEVNAEWFRITNITNAGADAEGGFILRYYWVCDENAGAERTAIATFRGEGDDGVINLATINITQYKADGADEPDEPEIPDEEGTYYGPIWKDVYYETYTEDFKYKIRVDDEIVYEGRSHIAPNAEKNRFNINRLCESFVKPRDFPFNGTVGYSAPMYRKFELLDEDDYVRYTYMFWYDWSYDRVRYGVLTNPIIPYVVDGQKLFFTVLSLQDEERVRWGMTYTDGEADYTNTEIVEGDWYTNIAADSRSRNIASFRIGDNVYPALPSCRCRYVLYYLNEYGGMDWLPILGRATESADVSQYQYLKSYDNTTTEFGKTRYMSTTTRRWKLNTGWLKQEQADLMQNVFRSNMIYLHDIKKDMVFPVICSDTSFEWKNRRWEKMINYEISLTASREEKML